MAPATAEGAQLGNATEQGAAARVAADKVARPVLVGVEVTRVGAAGGMVGAVLGQAAHGVGDRRPRSSTTRATPRRPPPLDRSGVARPAVRRSRAALAAEARPSPSGAAPPSGPRRPQGTAAWAAATGAACAHGARETLTRSL